MDKSLPLLSSFSIMHHTTSKSSGRKKEQEVFLEYVYHTWILRDATQWPSPTLCTGVCHPWYYIDRYTQIYDTSIVIHNRRMTYSGGLGVYQHKNPLWCVTALILVPPTKGWSLCLVQITLYNIRTWSTAV